MKRRGSNKKKKPKEKEDKIKQIMIRKLEKMKDGQKIAEAMDAAVQANIEAGNWKYEKERIEEDEKYSSYQRIVHPVNFALKESTTHGVRFVHNLSFSRGGSSSSNTNQK